ncbi:MAG TPA: preprotein translocase subunit YajC [Gaiellaceae bacterium]|nr:preprotein translocase subunit YajC [Gaiellaceae bacterium]
MSFSILFLLVILVLFWVLLIQPQRRRKQQQERLLGELAAGDEVITVGGIYGRVQAVRDDDVTLEVAPGTTLRVAKSAVGARVEPDEAKTPDNTGEAPLP